MDKITGAVVFMDLKRADLFLFFFQFYNVAYKVFCKTVFICLLISFKWKIAHRKYENFDKLTFPYDLKTISGLQKMFFSLYSHKLIESFGLTLETYLPFKKQNKTKQKYNDASEVVI